MDDHGEIGPGQVEWLDLGPADPPESTAAPRRSRRPWYLLAAAIALVVIVVAALNHDPKRTTAQPSRPPTTAVTQPTVASSVEASPTPVASPSIVVSNVGHRLLDVPADWVLIGRGTDSVVRIELARGRVTSTVAPTLDSGGGVAMVVGPDRVLVRPFDRVPGYEVRDGHPARALPPVFGQEGPVLPGPDRHHVWVTIGTNAQSVMRLVDFDGRPTGVSIRIPDGGQAGSDGAGYLTFYGTGGVYDARPGAVRRITGGDLIAVGPTRWLTRDCDEQYHCQTVVTERSTGARRVLAGRPDGFGDVGVIAPDGSYAALIRMTDTSLPALHMIDLATGHDTVIDVGIDADNTYGGGQMVWSPDSRWLFVAGESGQVAVLETRTMRTLDLGVQTPSITQVALRSGSN